MNELEKNLVAKLNILTKWRSVFAGWQLGTRSTEDPECQAVRDQRELIMLLRAENNALLALLVRARVFSREEFQRQMIEEADFLNKQYEEKFPGMRATSEGIEYFDLPRAQETMKNWRP
jgi:hypothetical protein